MIPKFLTVSRSRAQLELMAPWIHYLYYRGAVDGMSLIATQDEFDCLASPYIHRFFREFSVLQPRLEDITWLLDAGRRALREEAPEWLLLPDDPALADPLKGLAEELGIKVVTARIDGQVETSVGLLSGVEELELWLSQSPPLIATPRTPDSDFQSWSQGLPEGAGRLALSEDPRQTLRKILQQGSPATLIEPVNFSLGAATFRYGDYDSEWTTRPASHDLRALLQECDPLGGWKAEIAGRNFRISLGSADRSSWLDKFPLSGASHRIVVADSQNIAGSVLNHCTAINRYTHWQATALCAQKHPFIDYPTDDCRVFFAEQGLSGELRESLEQAEVFLFFEDDDETSSSWPFDLRPFVQGKPVLHLYIGHRVHRDVALNQRPGRTILTPLPHLVRMFPRAHFYAGFPPSTLNEVALRPPLSEKDGVVRVLHTPSLPHQTSHRYYYHKDTESYLEAAQLLRARAQFWQLGGLSHDKIIQARLDCDITFNQLRGYQGLSGDEAMYLERVNVQAFDRYNINRHREYWGMDVDFPWVDARPGQLAEVFAGLIEDRQRRRDIGERSRRFMLEYFSPQRGIIPLVYHCEKALEQSQGGNEDEP